MGVSSYDGAHGGGNSLKNACYSASFAESRLAGFHSNNLFNKSNALGGNEAASLQDDVAKTWASLFLRFHRPMLRIISFAAGNLYSPGNDY